MQRLGKNIGGYFGERIDIRAIFGEMRAAAAAAHWERDEVELSRDATNQPVNFIALRRAASSPRKRIYLSAGIHGDEPAGPLAVLQMLREDVWPEGLSLWLCPCLNFTGLLLGRRENADGVDLNRDYRHLTTIEARAHTEWLGRQPGFDIALCLHEDWESQGFYLYELNPDKQPSFAEKIVADVAEVCPIDTSPTIEKWPAENGVIRPEIILADRPQWPEAFYLVTNKTRLSYTLEAPSDFALATRAEALTKAVRAVLKRI